MDLFKREMLILIHKQYKNKIYFTLIKYIFYGLNLDLLNQKVLTKIRTFYLNMILVRKNIFHILLLIFDMELLHLLI